MGGRENVPYSEEEGVVEQVKAASPGPYSDRRRYALGYTTIWAAMSMERMCREFQLKPRVTVEKRIVRYNGGPSRSERKQRRQRARKFPGALALVY